MNYPASRSSHLSAAMVKDAVTDALSKNFESEKADLMSSKDELAGEISQMTDVLEDLTEELDYTKEEATKLRHLNSKLLALAPASSCWKFPHCHLHLTSESTLVVPLIANNKMSPMSKELATCMRSFKVNLFVNLPSFMQIAPCS